MKNSLYKKELTFERKLRSLVAPLFFVVSIMIISIVIILIQYRKEKSIKIKQRSEIAEKISKEIEFKLKGNLDFLELLASERAEGHYTEQTFHDNVKLYLNDHPEFINITWIDSSYTIKLVSPLVGNSQIIGLEVNLPEPKKASRMAKQNKKSIYTSPFEAIQSNASFEVWVPVFKENKFLGLFAGVYSCNRLLKSVVANESETMFVSLIDSNSVVLTKNPKGIAHTIAVIQKPLNGFNNGMQLKVEFNDLLRINWTIIILVVGLFVAVLAFAYSMWKVSVESELRKETQISLEKNEITLKKQNAELSALNIEYKKAKEFAIENQRLTRTIINTIPDLIWLKDINGKYLKCNRRFENLFGAPENEIIGKTDYDFVKKELADFFGYYDTLAVKIEQPSINEEQVTFAIDGHTELLETIKTPLYNENNKIVGILGIGRNITERKIAEEELKQAKEKAEESDRLKTEFINNMSHEIRTPMNGILGFSNLLDTPNITEQKRKHYISIIQSSGNQLMRIIDDILEISILGTKQVKLNERETCLNDLLLEQFSIFDIKAKENKTPLYLKKGLSDKGSIIITDYTKLNKILSNLLENAIKFTHTGFIEFGYELKTDCEPAKLEIYVKDTGIGINIGKQELIFERFAQEEKELSKSVGGLGLGLSIAKENTELLGGNITLHSEKGIGSTFLVTIPYKPVNSGGEDSEINKDIKTEKNDKYTILIVEDEEVNYLFIETLIVDVIDIKCIILHAKNGKEAVDICKENSGINFVLMDLKMPILNGFEATQLIKEFRPDLPIVAQTAYTTTEDKEKALLAGCDDFISKPISEEILNKIMNKYLLMK